MDLNITYIPYDQKINTIKIIRDFCSMGLKEAKNIIDLGSWQLSYEPDWKKEFIDAVRAIGVMIEDKNAIAQGQIVGNIKQSIKAALDNDNVELMDSLIQSYKIALRTI